MTGRRAIFGLCMLCALTLGAVAAQGAGAAGTTAVTCESDATGAGGFSDAHCKEATGSGNFKHVSFASNTTTATELTNVTTGSERAPFRLKATVAGLGLTLEAKKVSALGWMENKEEGGEMWAQGETLRVVFEEVTANLNCTVKGLPGHVGTVETLWGVDATTKGQGDAVKFAPGFETKFAEFELSGESCPAAVKGKYPIFGTVNCVPSGATCAFTHAKVTESKSLKLKSAEGPVAGLEGSITITASDSSNGATGVWPIAATTFP